MLREARPIAAIARAQLVRDGKATSVITQNIDGLHQDSGIPPAQVIELHGNTTYAHCLTARSAMRSPICGWISSATTSCRIAPVAAV